MAFKMKGHGLPGINQRMDKSSLEDGRAKSSAFQKGPGDRNLWQRLTGRTSTGVKLYKAEKKADSAELVAFKQELRNKRAADKAAKKAAKKAKRNENKSTKKKDWKVKIGNTTIGNTSNPTFGNNQEPSDSEKEAKMSAIDARSNKGYKIS